jgi:hypothetical protein
VLNLLTNYLLQYRKVNIPSVGSITLVQQPAQLNIADKVILPPAFVAEIGQEEHIPDHQLFFLSAALQEERAAVIQQLNALGERLRERIQAGGFYWKGIGLIRESREPMRLSLSALSPVPAERVLRPDAEHNVLVGDQQLTSTQLTALKEEVEEVTEKERSVFVIVGWVVLFLSILYIIFVLYQGRFRVGSTGSRQAPTSSLYLQQKENTSVFIISSNKIGQRTTA